MRLGPVDYIAGAAFVICLVMLAARVYTEQHSTDDAE